ncbi:hypothetical protein B566_EDAN008153 [Ephemera danica]|nr:hypothetical protein B566_EDAN008153 [Ephemera danica]
MGLGYGSTTPHTDVGKLVVILYGFLGCSGGILFFNLFLERIITFLAYALRSFHVRKLSKRVHQANGAVTTPGRPGQPRCVSSASLDDDPEASLDSWKPIVGCCCTYSLFNVTSIVIKQALNWIIVRLDIRCERAAGAANRLWRRQSQRIRRRRKSIAKPGTLRRQRRTPVPAAALRHAPICGVDGTIISPNAGETGDSDSVYDSDNERRLSGEMISMKDFLQANKVSLAVMQKQLYETAQMQRWGVSAQPNRPSSGGFTPGTVGPLAITGKKLRNKIRNETKLGLLL